MHQVLSNNIVVFLSLF